MKAWRLKRFLVILVGGDIKMKTAVHTYSWLRCVATAFLKPSLESSMKLTHR